MYLHKLEVTAELSPGVSESRLGCGKNQFDLDDPSPKPGSGSVLIIHGERMAYPCDHSDANGAKSVYSEFKFNSVKGLDA
jgi:hypothetical protein